jgi:hypothetical protein
MAYTSTTSLSRSGRYCETIYPRSMTAAPGREGTETNTIRELRKKLTFPSEDE